MTLPLWLCDDCGGPAKWTFIDGHPHYHCERQCDGFMQTELFDTKRVGEITRGGDALDAGRRLYELDEDDEPVGLPF